MHLTDGSDSAWPGRIFKEAFAVVEQSVLLVRKRVDENIRPPVAIVISRIDAHAREGLPVIVVTEPCQQADFFECAIVPVSKNCCGNESFATSMSGHPSRSKSFTATSPRPFPGLGAIPDFSETSVECSVSVVAIEQVRDRLELVGMAIGAVVLTFLAAIRIVFEAPLEIPVTIRSSFPSRS